MHEIRLLQMCIWGALLDSYLERVTPFSIYLWIRNWIPYTKRTIRVMSSSRATAFRDTAIDYLFLKFLGRNFRATKKAETRMDYDGWGNVSQQRKRLGWKTAVALWGAGRETDQLFLLSEFCQMLILNYCLSQINCHLKSNLKADIWTVNSIV